MADDSTPTPAPEEPAKKPKAAKAPAKSKAAKEAAKSASPAEASPAAVSPSAPPPPGAEVPAPTPSAPEAPEAPAPAKPTAEQAAKKPKAPKSSKAKETKPAKEEPAPVVDPLTLSLEDTIEPVKIVRAKGSKNITKAIAHILATFNNTIVSITDTKGQVIAWASAGKCGFKGSRKSTAYAAQVVAQEACKQAMGHGVREVEVRVKGPGSGRESAIRAMQAIGLEITVIRDVTPVPHNGCRPPKQRRV